MGKQFIDGTAPRIAKALERIAQALEDGPAPDPAEWLVRDAEATREVRRLIALIEAHADPALIAEAKKGPNDEEER